MAAHERGPMPNDSWRGIGSMVEDGTARSGPAPAAPPRAPVRPVGRAAATRAALEPGTSNRAPSAPLPDPAHAALPFDRGVAELVLGLRLLALAVVAGSGTLLPIASTSRPQLVAGILAGTALGAAQYLAARARVRALAEALI